MYECACGARVRARQGCQGPIQGTGRWGDHTFSTLTLPREPGRIKILMKDEVERMWPTPTVWERILQEDSIQPGVPELALTAHRVCLVTGLGPSRPS